MSSERVDRICLHTTVQGTVSSTRKGGESPVVVPSWRVEKTTSSKTAAAFLKRELRSSGRGYLNVEDELTGNLYDWFGQNAYARGELSSWRRGRIRVNGKINKGLCGVRYIKLARCFPLLKFAKC